MRTKRAALPIILTIFLLTAGLIVALTLVQNNQDIRQRASSTGAVAPIRLTPESDRLDPFSTQTIELTANTGFEQVVGFEITANLTGTIPSDISFQPASLTGLALATQSLTHNSTSSATLTLGFLADYDALYTKPGDTQPGNLRPFSTNDQTVTLGNFSFTAPDSGQLNISFSPQYSHVIDTTVYEDIIDTSQSYTYTFAYPPVSPTDPGTGGGGNTGQSTEPPPPTDPPPTDEPTASPTAPPTTPPTTPVNSITITTQFAGVAGNRGPIDAQVTVGTNGSTTPDFTTSATFTHTGSTYQTTINPTNITTGSGYWLTVKGEKHLRRAYTNLNLSSTNQINASNPQLPGDLSPQDGKADSIDLNQIFGAVSHPVQSQQDLDLADLNYDGVVNSIDTSLFITTLDNQYDETP